MSKKFFKTSEIAQVVGLSTQAVRNYEAMGLLPPVERTATGYRQYTQRHLQALQLSRLLITGFGWQYMHTIMHAIHARDIAVALATIDARHAELHQTRREVEEMLRILRDTSTNLPELLSRIPRHRNGLRVGEAAKLAGVRVSALRFWEQWGLLQPARDRDNRYRVYDLTQLRRLMVIALLRKTQYSIEAVRAVLDHIATGTVEQALAAAEHRLHDLTAISHACMQGTAELWRYIEGSPELVQQSKPAHEVIPQTSSD